MRNSLAAAATIAAVALAAPSAFAATLTVDPPRDCYREVEKVFLQGSGFTPNALVDISRGGTSLGTLSADASGAFVGDLDLPGLLRGQERLTYVAKDLSDEAITAEATVLLTATDVVVTPKSGSPNRRVRIRGRGFFGRRTVWAHVVRLGPGAGAPRVRNVRVGRVRGPCKRVRARRRLLRADAPAGEYRVQFDTFRRYKPKRRVEFDELIIEILG